MTASPATGLPMQPIVAVRPGPVLMVWVGGVEVAAVPLDHTAAVSLAIDLLTAARVRMPVRAMLPDENLPFDAHMARYPAEHVNRSWEGEE